MNRGDARSAARVRRVLIGVVVVVGLTLSPAAASATTYYAAPPPEGNDGNTCLSMADPCTLDTTVETLATTAGDEVIVLPGTYNQDTNTLQISNSMTVRGLSPQQRPQIGFDLAGQAVPVFAPAVMRDLGISNLGGVAISAGGGLVGERLSVSSDSSDSACSLFGGLLRDSACVNHSNGDALRVSAFAGTAVQRLVNVTARAPGNVALRVSGFGDGVTGAHTTVNATNLIASGDSTDIRTQTNFGTDSATVNLDHSNYASIFTGAPGTESITPAGTGSNQTATPLFQPGSGNFHQAAGSPTINRGATNPFQGGTRDLDGQRRCMGTRTDIGADEFTAPACVSGAQQQLQPPSGAADLLKAKVKGKKLIATLACAAAGGCAGNEIALRTAKKLDLSKIAVAAKRKRIVLAKGSFSLAAGERRTVRLKLRKQGRRLFKVRKKVRAKATIASPAGTATEKLKIKRK